MAVEKKKEEIITLTEFLESVPPGKQVSVSDLCVLDGQRYALNEDDLFLYCDNEECKGERYFEFFSDGDYLRINAANFLFLHYRCRNCRSKEKTIAVVIILRDAIERKGDIYKYGEVPSFGPPVPSRVFKLIGPDQELFLKGRRAENQGMGIGAFTYYRRVIENQKDRIFDEIIRVVEKISPSPTLIKELNAAKKETQFSKAVDSIKTGIPQIFLIEGQNPLTLLHSALSGGLHAQSDEECLEMATSIRIVLTEFAERVNQALKDKAELKDAVTRLISKKQQSQPKKEIEGPE